MGTLEDLVKSKIPSSAPSAGIGAAVSSFGIEGSEVPLVRPCGMMPRWCQETGIRWDSDATSATSWGEA